MNKILKLIVTACLSVVILPPCIAQKQDYLSELASEVKSAVVTIYSEQGGKKYAGSGFIMDEFGNVMTCFHVVYDDKRNVLIRSLIVKIDNETYKAEIADFDKYNDLAILSLSNLKKKAPDLQVSGSKPLDAEKIIIIGTPKGVFEKTINEGRIAGVRNWPQIGTVYQLDANLGNPGSSGSPVINLDKKVIGAYTFDPANSVNLHFAIPGNRMAILQTRFYAKAVKSSRDNAMLFYYLGRAKGASGRNLEAVVAYEQAVQIDSTIAKAHAALGVTYYLLGNRGGKTSMLYYKKAADSLRQAVRIDPFYGRAYFNLGLTYQKLGKSQDSQEVCNKLQELSQSGKLDLIDRDKPEKFCSSLQRGSKRKIIPKALN